MDNNINEREPLINEENTINPKKKSGPKRVKKEVDPREVLPLSTKLIYGFPNFPFSLACNFYSTYVFKYYTDVVNVPLELLNVCYIIQLFVLVLLFPVLGWVFDVTNTRWGRRRPWIVTIAPLYFLLCVTIWIPPREFPLWITHNLNISNENCIGGYYTIIYGLTVILTYMVQTPYMSLGVELSLDFDERSSLFGYSQAFYVLGVIISTGFPELLLKWYPDTRLTFTVISIITGIIGIISFEIMCIYIKERPDFIREDKTPLISGIRSSFIENKPFIILLIVITLQNSAPYTMSLLPYWVEYTLQLDDIWGSIIMTIFISSGFLFIPFWNFIAKLWGKRKAYGLSLGVSVIGYVLMSIPNGNDQIVLSIFATLLCGMSGIYLTLYNFLYQSLQGDVIDYDELRTGMRRESTYANIMQYFNWYMSVFSTSSPFFILSLLHFDADSVQSKSVNRGIGLLIGSSGIFSLIGMFVLYFYPISKQKYLLIIDSISNLKNGIPSIDPLSNKMIDPPSIRSSIIPNDIYWLLYSFSHSELKSILSSNGSYRRLKMSCWLWMILWMALNFGFLSLWVIYPSLYIIWGYSMLLSTSLFFYHLLRLRASYQLERLCISVDLILFVLLLYTSNSILDNIAKGGPPRLIVFPPLSDGFSLVSVFCIV